MGLNFGTYVFFCPADFSEIGFFELSRDQALADRTISDFKAGFNEARRAVYGVDTGLARRLLALAEGLVWCQSWYW